MRCSKEDEVLYAIKRHAICPGRAKFKTGRKTLRRILIDDNAEVTE